MLSLRRWMGRALVQRVRPMARKLAALQRDVPWGGEAMQREWIVCERRMHLQPRLLRDVVQHNSELQLGPRRPVWTFLQHVLPNEFRAYLWRKRILQQDW